MSFIKSFGCCLLAVLAWTSTGLAADRATEFYVSPTGADHHPGTKEQPFASLQQARTAVRQVIKDGPDRDLIVWLREGTYRLTAPLEFGPEDGGTGEFHVTYTAYPGEEPVISGGRLVTHWKGNPDGSWSAQVDQDQVREFFVNGERRVRARQPNNGYYRVAQSGEDRRTNFTYNEGDVRNYEDLKNVELIFLHDWSISRVPVQSVDEAARRLTVAQNIGPSSRHFAIDHFEKHPRYYLENSIEFLDAPGEWHWNQETGTLTYLPLPGETMETAETVVPAAKGLIQVAGKPEQPVRRLRFIGISFEHSAWPLPEKGYAAGQAGFHERRYGEGGALREPLPAALHFSMAEDCLLSRTRIRHIGASGIWFGRQCRGNIVEQSTISDISGNGIMIGEDRSRTIDGQAWWQSAPSQAASGQIVRHCLIERCGQQFFGAVGVWIGLAQDNQILHNEIRHHPYTGVSIGWMWNPTPTPCKGNVVAANHIHHVMQVLSDGGGIYTLGHQPGSELRQNVIHDVPLNLGRAESNGMFIDEGSTGLLIADNLIYNIQRSPLRFHRATVNLVSNNTLFVEGEIPAFRYNNTKAEDIKKVENHVIPISSQNADLLKSLEAQRGQAGPQAFSSPTHQHQQADGSPQMTERERAFAESLSNVKLQGRSSMLDEDGLGEIKDDHYYIERITKVSGDSWIVHSRVGFKNLNLIVPVPVQVYWAGDTPVISLTDLNIPTLGTYTARVAVHAGTYAGTWSGSGHAGLIFGTIQKEEKPDDSK